MPRADVVAPLAALYAASGPRLEAAIGNLVKRAGADGDIRVEVEPFDLLRAIGALAYAGPGSDWEARARQMVDILISSIKRA